MADLFIIGGQQRYLRPLLADDATWYEYQKGIIIQLDTLKDTSRSVIEYVSPNESRSENEAATLFKSAAIHGDTLYACTQTEVILYSLPNFVQIAYLSLPCFNDVHHVVPTPWGTIAVAVAGLDMVVEITQDGRIVKEYNVLDDGDPWAKFRKDVDYRQISTKPHQSHPNFLFFVDDELWTTRFQQKDAISMKDPSRRIDIQIGLPHDGLVQGDFIYFTTVNGRVVIANKNTLRVEQIVNLNEFHDYAAPLGWCRGVLVEDQDKMWVGFSRIRPTKLRENVEWVKRSLKAKLRPVLPSSLVDGSKWVNSKLRRELPTHVACYDLTGKGCISEQNVEKHGISAIFSIFSGAAVDARIQDNFTDKTIAV